MVYFDFGPPQAPLDAERVAEILDWHPRRMRVGGQDWPEPLHPPQEPGRDWSLVLPFCETLANAFNYGCTVQSIGMRSGKGSRCYTFLTGTADSEFEDLGDVRAWLDRIGRFVAIRDGLCQSFALDFDRHDGDPNQERTEVGSLRATAKPYGDPATAESMAAAEELLKRMLGFLEEMPSYESVNAVVAMPPSNPDKPFDLPTCLAGEIARALDVDDLSPELTTVAARPALKNLPKEEKLEVLDGTLEADETAFVKKSVLLVDDLYQSGASANMAAVTMLDAGAHRVLGLFCEKTCRNDANVS